MRKITVLNGIFLFLALLVIFPVCTLIGAENREIDLSIDFSIDGGKTFVSEAVVPAGAVVWVRASWDYFRDDGCKEPYLFAVRSAECDFASANVGLRHRDGHKFWYQKNKRYYVGENKNSVIIKIDTGKRDAGIMGFMNKWDKDSEKFIDAPLSSCKALATGTHSFSFDVYYYRQNVKPKKVGGEKQFAITISDSGKKSSVADAPVTPQRHFVEVGMRIPTSEYQFDSKGFCNLASNNVLAASGNMIKVPVGYYGWIVGDDVVEDEYFLSWVIQSGRRSGMDNLDQIKPLLYLNGRPVHFDFAKGPQRQGAYFVTVVRTDEPLLIKPGDHLRVAELLRNNYVGSLGLHRIKPAGFPVCVRHFSDYLIDEGIELECAVLSRTNGVAVVQASVRNITATPMKAALTFSAVDYWRVPVTNTVVSLVLEPYMKQKILLDLPIKTFSPRFSGTVVVTSDDGQFLKIDSAELFNSFISDFRSFQWLNAGWTVYNVPVGYDSEIPPEGMQGKQVSFPTMYYSGRDLTRLFVNTFVVNDLSDTNIPLINFEGQGDVLSLWINGNKIFDNSVKNGVPFQIDASKLLVAGKNSISILTRPCKLPMRDIFIESVPVCNIERVLIVPSFRKKEISIKAFMDNADGMTLCGAVYYEGQKVLDVPLFKTENAIAETEVLWPDPVLWDTDNPRLLELRLSLQNAAGEVVDVKSERFGFREIWVDGFNIYLNGKPRRFKACAMNTCYDWAGMQPAAMRRSIQNKKRGGISFLRHVYYGEAYASIADEEGMLMAQGLQTIFHPTVGRILDDKLWQEKDSLSLETVKNLYNHPSIVEWYISNEFSETMRDDNLELARKRLWNSQQAVKALDSSRLFGHGCDLDIGGRNDFYSTHYPVDLRALRTISVYTPDACLWRMPDQQFEKGMMVPAGLVKSVANVHFKSPIEWGVKPVFVGEFGWNMFYNPPGGYMQISGDKVLSSVWAMENAHAKINAMFNAGHRDAEVSLYTTWVHSVLDFYRLVPDVDIYLWNQSAAWYGGVEIKIPFDIFYDASEKGDCSFVVNLEVNGEIYNVENTELKLNPADVYRNEILIKTPEVDKIENAFLRCELIHDGIVIAEKNKPVKIYPKNNWQNIISNTDVTILIYDPVGSLEKRLNAQETSGNGFSIKKISSLKDLVGTESLPLLVAENALDKADADDIAVLSEFTVAGGRVFLLHQKDVHGLFNMSITPKVSSIAFVRAPNDPVMRNFKDKDFKYWYPGSVVSRNDYKKPKSMPGISLLDTGSGVGGLEYTPLYKMMPGKGICYMCQMILDESYGDSPVADDLFATLLNAIIKSKPEEKSLGVFVESGSKLEKFLEKLKLGMDSENPLSSYSAVFCDANLLTKDDFRVKLQSYLENGGVVYLKNVDFSTKEAVVSFLGSDLDFAENDIPAFKGRELILRKDPLLDGLSQEDFFWRRWQESENTKGSFRTDKDLIGITGDLQIVSDNGEQLLYPGGLFKKKVGEGVVYIDVLNWDKASPLLKRKSHRIARLILNNLGGEFQFNLTRALNLANLSFETIDLEGLFNRGCIDEVEDDGKGSWNDQGSKLDMRQLKTGKITVEGIPFVLEKDGKCVALHSRFRKAELPTEVEITVNRKIRGLAFLHTSAWTGPKNHGAYIVHYKDGTEDEIPLVGGITLRDWTDPEYKAEFPNNTSVKTGFALSCKIESGRNASLYRLVWTNPRPFIEVSYVSFKSANKAILALFSVTAIVDNKNENDNSVIDSAQKNDMLKNLVEKGITAYQGGDISTARKLFEEIVASGFQDTSVYLLLGDIYSDNEEYDKAEKVLGEVILFAPEELESYTKLGALYEKQGKMKDALDIYRKSFAVEHNQPWIMHSIERLKAQQQ